MVNKRRQVDLLREPLSEWVVCMHCGNTSQGLLWFRIQPQGNVWKVHQKYLCPGCALKLPNDSGLKTQVQNAVRRYTDF